MRRAVTVIALTTLASSALQAAPPRAQRVAVYDLELSEVPARLGRVMTDAIVEEVRKLEGVAVVGMSEIRAMLDHEAQKQLVGCSDDSCVAEIAEALGVDSLVVGSLATIGTDRVFLLKRIDQRAAATASSFNVRVAQDDEDSLLASLGGAIAQLFPERPLRAGMSRGVSERISKRLRPPPLAPGIFYGLLGTSGAAALAAAVVTAPALLTVLAFEDYKTDPTNKDAYLLKEHQERGELAQAWVLGAVTTWSVAAVGAVLTGVAWPLTDFRGEDASEELGLEGRP